MILGSILSGTSGLIDAADVSAVIVTRGDVPLDAILNSLPFGEVVVWNNAERDDYQCYGRFAAIAETTKPHIYVQDDDILVPIPALLRAYDPEAETILANKKPDEEWRFLGVGALFPRHFADNVFGRYIDLYGFNRDFGRIADVVFAYQLPYESLWLGYAELEWSRAPNRMYHELDHMAVRERARKRTLALPNPV